GVVFYREIDMLARRDHQRRSRCCKHGEASGAHQACYADDLQVALSDVEYLKGQILRSLTDGSEGKIVFQIDGDRGAFRLDEGKCAPPIGCCVQDPIPEHKVEHGNSRKMNIVKNDPG